MPKLTADKECRPTKKLKKYNHNTIYRSIFHNRHRTSLASQTCSLQTLYGKIPVIKTGCKNNKKLKQNVKTYITFLNQLQHKAQDHIPKTSLLQHKIIQKNYRERLCQSGWHLLVYGARYVFTSINNRANMWQNFSFQLQICQQQNQCTLYVDNWHYTAWWMTDEDNIYEKITIKHKQTWITQTIIQNN